VSGVSDPLPLRLVVLLADVCLRHRRAGKNRRRWVIANVRTDDKLMTAEVTK